MFKNVVLRETPNSKPKIIGRYDSDTNVFETTRSIKKHLLRNQNAWAIDLKLFKTFLVPRNATIKIIEPNIGMIYTASVNDFSNFGSEIEYLNHRPQICLNRSHFVKEEII